MGTIDYIGLGFSVSTSALASGLGRARSQINSFGSALTSAKGLFLSFAGAVGVGLTADAFASFVKGGLDAVDTLNDTAARLSTNTELLGALNYAAKLSGSSAEALAAALTKMQVNLGKAEGDNNPFAKIGLSIDDLKSKDPTAAFAAIAEAISQIKSPAEQAAAAQAIFGKGATEVMQLLQGGKAGITELTDEFKKLGIGISAIDASKAAAANDALDKISMVIGGIKNRLAVELAPFIEAIANAFVEWASSGQSMGSIVTSAVEMVAQGIAFAADILDVFKLGWELLQAGVTKAIALIVRGIAMMGEGLEALINLLPGVEVDFTSTLTAIADELDKLAGEQWDKFNEDLIAPSAGEKVTKFFDNIRRSAQTAAEGMQPVKTTIDDIGESMSKATEDAGKFVDKLKEQVATFGMTSNEAEIYKLQIAGADEAVLGQARSLDEQLKALEESKKAHEEMAKAQEDLTNEGKKVFEETRTPLEQYEAKIKDLEKLLDVGAINQDTFNRAVAKAQGELGGESPTELKFAGAALFGSSEARTAILQHRGIGKDPMTDLRKINSDQLVEQKTATEYLRQLAANRTTFNVINDF